jgi:hypothetical protein
VLQLTILQFIPIKSILFSFIIFLVVFKKTVSIVVVDVNVWLISLTSETVQGTALAFQSVDDVHGGDCLSLGVFSVGDGITNDVFKEHLQDTTGFFVDQSRDTLDTTTAGQTTDSWLGDTLDVITQDFAMTLGSSFSETFSSFAATGHVDTLLLSVFSKRKLKLK